LGKQRELLRYFQETNFKVAHTHRRRSRLGVGFGRGSGFRIAILAPPLWKLKLRHYLLFRLAAFSQGNAVYG
jgi:hypothetical protein